MPRPGIVRTLGIINIASSVLILISSLAMAFTTLAIGMNGSQPSDSPDANPAAFMGDPALVRFYLVDLATGLPLNILMFATGIGLINARRWGAWWWTRAAWVKIVRLIALYGYFILDVVPMLSAGMARMAMSVFEAQKFPPGRAPTLAQMTMMYGYAYSALSAGMIVLGVIYPAVSIWSLGRPGVKAALSDPDGTTEREASLP